MKRRNLYLKTLLLNTGRNLNWTIYYQNHSWTVRITIHNIIILLLLRSSHPLDPRNRTILMKTWLDLDLTIKITLLDHLLSLMI